MAPIQTVSPVRRHAARGRRAPRGSIRAASRARSSGVRKAAGSTRRRPGSVTTRSRIAKARFVASIRPWWMVEAFPRRHAEPRRRCRGSGARRAPGSAAGSCRASHRAIRDATAGLHRPRPDSVSRSRASPARRCARDRRRSRGRYRPGRNRRDPHAASCSSVPRRGPAAGAASPAGRGLPSSGRVPAKPGAA